MFPTASSGETFQGFQHYVDFVSLESESIRYLQHFGIFALFHIYVQAGHQWGPRNPNAKQQVIHNPTTERKPQAAFSQLAVLPVAVSFKLQYLSLVSSSNILLLGENNTHMSSYMQCIFHPPNFYRHTLGQEAIQEAN